MITEHSTTTARCRRALATYAGDDLITQRHIALLFAQPPDEQTALLNTLVRIQRGNRQMGIMTAFEVLIGISRALARKEQEVTA
jgi:hypothetical protein